MKSKLIKLIFIISKQIKNDNNSIRYLTKSIKKYEIKFKHFNILDGTDNLLVDIIK